MKKLHISLIFSKLEVTKPIVYIITRMHNFIVKFGKILDIFKKFAGNPRLFHLKMRRGFENPAIL